MVSNSDRLPDISNLIDDRSAFRSNVCFMGTDLASIKTTEYKMVLFDWH